MNLNSTGSVDALWVNIHSFPVPFQLATTPLHSGYGFSKPKIAKFPSLPEPDYASSCRLFIQPIPLVDSKHQAILR